MGDGNILTSPSAKGNKHTKRFTATTCASPLSPYNIDAVYGGDGLSAAFYSIFNILHVAAERGGGSKGGAAPCSRAEGSLPSLIAVQFARCLYDGVCEVRPAAEFTALFLRHMRNPRSTPAANAVPLETRPAPLCR